MRFEKWQALGNDYAIVEEPELPFELTRARVQRLCAAHIGLGSDGLLLLSRTPAPEVVARLRIFNPDGSEAELSGNGARQAVLYLRRRGWTAEDDFAIATAAGAVRARITGRDSCEVTLARARLSSDDYPSGRDDGRGTLIAAEREFRFQHVLIGNPQCAIELQDDLHDFDLRRYGAEIESHELFPNRTNVSFWRRTADSQIEARIFERGVGETLSSGTGAGGAAVAAVLNGVKSPVRVHLPGGDLEVEVSEELEVTLTGSAVPVFSGELSEELVDELRAPEAR